MSLASVAVTLQLALPLALLLWQWRRQDSARGTWLLNTLAVGAYLAAVREIGIWAVLPWYVAGLYLLVWTLLAVRDAARIKSLPWWPSRMRARTTLGLALSAALTLDFGALAVLGVRGHRPLPGAAADLTFPLRHGTYLIASGGSNGLLNLHAETLKGSYEAFRAQSYAVDIMKLNRFGMRASGVMPKRLSGYAIFGDSVYAPCAGTVKHVESQRPDFLPPARDDAQHMMGNYVLLACRDDVDVFLGHLQQGSVLVQPGESVREGQPLGRVGNSGNTDEPHLHIHAQRPSTTGYGGFLAGAPLAMRFHGRFLARNDRLHVEREQP